MAGDVTPEEVAAIVEQISRGDDSYRLPPELLEEPEHAAGATPVPSPAVPDEVNPSLYVRIMKMTVGEKIKLALKGNRDARNILIRDSSHIVPRFVLQNPRVTDDEIVGVARNRNLDAELLRIIGEDKDWARNQQVRSALVNNPKTPIAIALHFVGSLPERELRLLAKSKNVTSAVAGAAKRILLQRTSSGR